MYVSSTASSLCGTRARFAYGASKVTVLGLAKSVAADFIGRNIRCNAICPEVLQILPRGERIRDGGDGPEAVRASFLARQRMGRVGQPEEVAALAVHLAGDESSFTTGSIYNVNGGRSL